MVHRASSQDGSEPSAETKGWIVARTIKDFQTLHSKLKEVSFNECFYPQYIKYKYIYLGKLMILSVMCRFVDYKLNYMKHSLAAIFKNRELVNNA